MQNQFRAKKSGPQKTQPNPRRAKKVPRGAEKGTELRMQERVNHQQGYSGLRKPKFSEVSQAGIEKVWGMRKRTKGETITGKGKAGSQLVPKSLRGLGAQMEEQALIC